MKETWLSDNAHGYLKYKDKISKSISKFLGYKIDHLEDNIKSKLYFHSILKSEQYNNMHIINIIDKNIVKKDEKVLNFTVNNIHLEKYTDFNFNSVAFLNLKYITSKLKIQFDTEILYKTKLVKPINSFDFFGLRTIEIDLKNIEKEFFIIFNGKRFLIDNEPNIINHINNILNDKISYIIKGHNINLYQNTEEFVKEANIIECLIY